MHLHLYRPVMLSRAGRCVCLTDARDVSPREAAALVRLRLATWVDFGESGEAGRAYPWERPKNQISFEAIAQNES